MNKFKKKVKKKAVIRLDMISFYAVTSAQTYIRNILNKYTVGHSVSKVDHGDLMALLLHHPDCHKIVGPGLKDFVIKMKGKRRFFYGVRSDNGLHIEFDWNDCFRGFKNE